MINLYKTSIAILLFAAIATAGCTDDLNQQPVIEAGANTVYQDAANYKSVMAKIYASYSIAGQEQGGENKDLSLVNGYDFLRGYFNLQEAGTDEVANTWLAGDNIANLTYLSWDVNDPWVSDSYYRLYYTIALCNELLRHCSDGEIAKFSDAEQADIRNCRAEARFMRALSYYLVLDLYRKGPFVDEDSPTSAYIPEALNARGLYDYVEKELIDLTDNDLLKADCYGRASTYAALCLLSRLYLNSEVYVGEDRYTDCVAACRRVIDSGRFSLAEDYASLFNADNCKRTNEIIFSFIVDGETTVSWGATTFLVCGQCGNSSAQDPAAYGLDAGWGMFRVRGELPAKFGDPLQSPDARCRFFTTGQTQWFTGAIDDQSQGFFSEKYSNLLDDGTVASSTQAVGASIDWPFFRLAEVYLTAAEAVSRGGAGMSAMEALGLVNQVRTRSGSNAIAIEDMTTDFFLDERAREFYHEAMRRTDLIRYNRFTTGEYLWQWKGGVLEGRPVDAKYNYYPIPATELTANPNLRNEEY